MKTLLILSVLLFTGSSGIAADNSSTPKDAAQAGGVLYPCADNATCENPNAAARVPTIYTQELPPADGADTEKAANPEGAQ